MDLNLGCHARSHLLGVRILEGDPHTKSAPERARARFLCNWSDITNDTRERELGITVEPNDSFRTDVHAPVVDVAQLRNHLHLAEVGDARDHVPGPHRIAHLELAVFAPDVADDQHATARRVEDQLGDGLLGDADFVTSLP